MTKKKHFETEAIRNQLENTSHKEHSVPIFPTSSFIFESAEDARNIFAEDKEGNIYSRYSNPNTDEFVNKMCKLEFTEAGIATSSGMSAIFLSFISYLKAGDHIVSSRSIFGSSHQILTQILPRWGISHTYVDIDDIDEWEKAVMPNTRMLFTETPSNPGLEICDISALSEIALKYNLILNVDNTFATPYLQNPAKAGAHLISHSATKFIDGQGRTLGGVLLGKKSIIKDAVMFARNTGPSLSPFNAWILSKSLETLAIRMKQHCKSAEKLAGFLENSNDVKSVRYPFLKNHPQYELAKQQMKSGGGLVSFELEGGEKRCTRFINHLKLLSLTSNLGDTRTTITHPATTTHSRLTEEEREAVGISNGLVRVSVGLENSHDIIEDIEQAMNASR